MSAYLDASVIVPLFLADPFTARAESVLLTPGLRPVVSDWAVLEVSNVVSRRVRIQALTSSEGESVLTDFDVWREKSALGATVSTEDMSTATSFVRQFDLALRGPDALHIALARRLRLDLITFDNRMAAAGAALGLHVTS